MWPSIHKRYIGDEVVSRFAFVSSYFGNPRDRKEILRRKMGDQEESSAGTSEDSQSTTSQAAQPFHFLATEVRKVLCFNPREDPNNLSVRSKRWKRLFQLYLLTFAVEFIKNIVQSINCIPLIFMKIMI